jgi:uncharacterized protein
MPNRLAHETSPYLLQHAHNPVDWYPWGPEALERARREDRPILLSIGYAACHWCHVMERESFEDAATASLMNEHFVNIKVDREERPDLDNIYMQATQAMTGRGGWPMTVFLTPEGLPFYAGTYFPPQDRHGIPSFARVLRSVAEAYRNKRGSIEQTTAAVRDIYEQASSPALSSGALTAQTLERAYRVLAAQFDVTNGGFGGAPKFPPSMTLDFLLRYARRTETEYAREMVELTFRKMARGGLYDQVGGGFARYAVDAVWLVPHFEKMLYDNALLARLGVHLWQLGRDPEVRRVTEETVDWVAREMTDPAGGFYSSLDADSEGHEGKFYVWDEAELDELLGPSARTVKTYFGVTPTGNFEGRNILFIPNDPMVVARRLGVSEQELATTVRDATRTLYTARAERVWPGRDDKVLAAWNGLMLRAVSAAARAFGRDDYRALAVNNGEFLLREMVRDGRAVRSYKGGVIKPAGFLEDQAAVALGLVALHELTFERRWLDEARRMTEAMVEWFWDDDARAFYDTPKDHERLITRPRDVTDNATPAGNSLAVELLLHVGDLLNDADMHRRAAWVLETLAEPMARHPAAFGHLLGAADMAVHGPVELALVGSPSSADFRELAAGAAMTYVPSFVLAGGAPDDAGGIALLDARPMVGRRATAYVCRGYACEAPTVDAGELVEQLMAAGIARRG